MDYVRRLRDLSAMQDWYQAALAETWRETEHENELIQIAKCTADLRAGAQA